MKTDPKNLYQHIYSSSDKEGEVKFTPSGQVDAKSLYKEIYGRENITQPDSPQNPSQSSQLGQKQEFDYGRTSFDEGVIAGWKGLKSGAMYATGEVAGWLGNEQVMENLQAGARETLEAAPMDDDSWSFFLGSLVPSSIPTAAAIAAAPFVGPAGATALGIASITGLSFSSAGNGMMEYETYKESIGQEVDPLAKVAVGGAYGAAEGLMERFQLGKLMPTGFANKILKGNVEAAEKAGGELLEKYAQQHPSKYRQLLKKVYTGMGTEGLEESMTELAQFGTQYLYYEDEDRRDLLEELPETMYKAFLGGAIMGGALGPLSYASQNKIHNDRRRSQGRVYLAENSSDGQVYELIAPIQSETQDGYQALSPDGEVTFISKTDIGQTVDLTPGQFQQLLRDKLDTQAFEKARQQAGREPITIATYEGKPVQVVGNDTSGDVYIRTSEGTRLVPRSELSDMQTISPEQQVQADKQENPSAIQDPETGEFLTPDDPGYEELSQRLQGHTPDSVVPIGAGQQARAVDLFIQSDGSYQARSVTGQVDGVPVSIPISEMNVAELQQVMNELEQELRTKGDFTIDAFPVEPGNPASPMQLFVVPSNSEAGQHLAARQQQEAIDMQQQDMGVPEAEPQASRTNVEAGSQVSQQARIVHSPESISEVLSGIADADESGVFFVNSDGVIVFGHPTASEQDYESAELSVQDGRIVGLENSTLSEENTAIIQQAIDLVQSGQPQQADPVQVDPVQVDPAIEAAPEQATVSDSIDNNRIYEFDGYTGNLTLDGKTVVIEGADTIVEIGNVDELSGSTLESLGISVISESGVEVSSDFSVTIGDRKYSNGYSNPMSAVTYDDQGNVINVTLDAEDGKKRTFRGQNADEIAYQYQLLFYENNATEQQIDNAIAQAENADAETETQQTSIEQAESDPVQSETEQVEAQREEQVEAQGEEQVEADTQVDFEPESTDSVDPVQSEPDQAQQQEELSLELDMKEALIDEFIENHNEQPFGTTDSHGTDIVVSRRTDGTDGWRLTTYRNGQPTGHTNYRSYESLLNELVFQFNGNLDSAEFSQSQAEQGPPRASTQFNVTGDIAKQAIDFGKSIPDSEIYTDGNDYGRETEPHVTLFYGLTEDAPDAVRDLIEGSGEVEVEFGEVSVFQNENYDVLMVEVESPRLRELHQQIKDELPNETDFPDYNPHMTIAYLKPGEGEKYMGDNQFQGQKTTFGELYHSGFDRKKTSIGMRPAAAPEAQSLETGTAEVGTVNPQFQDAPKAEGREHTRTLENGESRDSQFMVVPLSSILASHNEVNFSQTEGYPTLEDGRTANDNDYQNSREAQENVDNIARNLDERVFQNVPTVSSDGIVVDGNNRTMSMKLAQRSYPERWANYQAQLQSRLEEFGIDPSQLAGIENPVLIRVDRDVKRYDTETYSKYNRQPNKEKSDVDRAVIASKKMTVDGLRRLTSLIDFETYNTINEALNDRKTGKQVIDLLQNLGLISANERVRFFDSKIGAVTPDGKNFVSMVARGSLLTERALRNSAMDGVRQLSNNMESSLPILIGLRANHPDFDLSPYLSQAINAEKMRSDQGLTNDELYGQMSMFNEMSIDKDTALLHFLLKKGSRNFKRAMQVYSAGAESNTGNQLFASETRNQGQLIDDVITYLENKYTDDESRQSIQRVQRLARPQAPDGSQSSTADSGPTDTGRPQQPQTDTETTEQGAQRPENLTDILTGPDQTESTRSQELSAKETRLKDELKELFNELNDIGGSKLSVGIDPKLIATSSKIIAKGAELGYVKFQQFANFVVENMGSDFWRNIFDNFKASYMANTAMQGNPNNEDLNALAKAKADDYLEGNTLGNEDITDNLTQQETDNVSTTTSDLESVSPRTANQNAVGTQDVQSDGTGDRQSPGRGSQRALTEELQQQGDPGLSDSAALATGKRGDQEISTDGGQPGTDGNVAGDLFGGRSVTPGHSGVQTDGQRAERATATTTQSAPKGNAQLTFEQKIQQQKDAESIKVRLNDPNNVRETLPLLFSQQQDDVIKAEKRFSQPSTYENPTTGMLFTNGTGTGKTFTGLGIAKRFHKTGKKNILIVVPTDHKAKDWIADGQHLQLNIRQLSGITDAGSANEVVVTTYANFRQNEAIADKDYDLVIYDESHKIMSSQGADRTAAFQQHKYVTNAPSQIYTKAAHRIVGRPLEPKKGYEFKYEYEQSPQGYGNAYYRRPIGSKGKWEHVEFIISDGGKGEETVKSMYYSQHEALKKEHDKEIRELSDKLYDSTKTVFLSATPFSYVFNLDYADGYLFQAEEGAPQEYTGYNQPGPREAFYIKNFGYKMRYNRMEIPEAEVNTSIMERNFHEKLQETGALSKRILDLDYDYSRDFILVDDHMGSIIDNALTALHEDKSEGGERKYPNLGQYVKKQFTWVRQNQILESIKAREAIPRLENHLEQGRKVVVFHTYLSHDPVHPFDFSQIKKQTSQEGEYPTLWEEAQEFARSYPEAVNLDLSGLINPVDTILGHFGDRAAAFNGTIRKSERFKSVQEFNKDDSGVDILVVQMEAGKEGISMHDTQGNKQRVMHNLGLPYKPTDAIQTEGRIYRVGQQSNAIFEYPVLHLNFEHIAFAQKISERTKTAENLALGNKARNLEVSFKEGYTLAQAEVSEQGTGGKEMDYLMSEITPFQAAKTYYYSRQKRNSRTKPREGTDYFATPEPIGMKMAEWLGLSANEKGLEPSAGHGAIARFFPENTRNTFIEPSLSLSAELQMNAVGNVRQDTFEEMHVVNKFHGIAMNPPFGTGGKTAMEHVSKAFGHLYDGGRLVAIVPDGPAMQNRLDTWMESDQAQSAVVRMEISMPSVTFERAGTKVRTKILVIDKLVDQENVNIPLTQRLDFSSETNIDNLFDFINDTDAPARFNIEDAEVQNLEAYAKAEASIESSSGLIEIVATRHTRDDYPIWVARLNQRVDREVFNAIREISNSHNGYYSRYNKGGAIPGFIFKSEQDANQFMQDVNNQSGLDSDLVVNEGSAEYVSEGQLSLNFTPADEAINFGSEGQAERNKTEVAKQVEAKKVEGIETNKGTIYRRSLLEGFKESGYVDMIGQQVNDVQDLADLYTIHRSPLIEKFHVVGLDANDRIVYSSAITSNASTYVAVPASHSNAMLDSAIEAGATRIALLHNHPSGNPEPSRADMRLTGLFGRLIIQKAEETGIDVRFWRHIVLNETEFSAIIDRYTHDTLSYKNTPKSFFKDNRFEGAITDQNKLAEVGNYLTKDIHDDSFAVVYLNTQAEISGYDILHKDTPIENVVAEYQRLAENDQVTRVAFIGKKTNVQGLLGVEMPAGMEVIDVLLDTGHGFRSLRDGDPNNRTFRTRRRPDNIVQTLWEPIAEYNNESGSTYQDLLQQIKEKAQADGTFMKAPNGQPTKLSEQQWLQVRTPAFKDWFGEWQLEQDLVSLIDNNNNTIDYAKLKDITDRVTQGDQTLGRLTSAEERGRAEGGRRNVEASLILRAKESANRQEQTRRPKNQTWGEHKRHVKPQEDLLEKYAREQGIWLDFETIQSEHTFIDEGKEAKVFEESNNTEFVLKTVGYDFARSDTTPQEYLDRIALHNYLFPETNYELVGFTKDGEYFKFVLRQQFVEGQAASEQELIDYMKDVHEAESVSITNARFANPNYFIDDLHELNVLKDADGNFHFIDPIVGLNYRDDMHGGVRERISNATSKMVDENGEPMVAYHGTNRQFNEFRSDAGRSHDRGFYGEGFYFTFGHGELSAAEASYYGRNIMPVYLQIDNPFNIGELSKYKGEDIRIVGTETYVFLKNLAETFPELGETITVTNNKGDNIPIKELPVLFDKYSKDLKTFEVESNDHRGNYKVGYVKSEEVTYIDRDTGESESYESHEELGRMLVRSHTDTEMEAHFVVEAIQKYEGIDIDLHPEGIMTRNPQITEAIKNEGHDGIMQTEHGDEVVVFSPLQIKSATENTGTFDSGNPDIRLIRDSQPAAGQQISSAERPKHRKMVRSTIDNITKKWANNEFVNVVDSVEDLPARILNQLIAEDGHQLDRVSGIFNNFQVYIISDNIRDADHARRVLAHETFGHLGLRALIAHQSYNARDFEGRFSLLMNEVYDSFKDTPKFKEITKNYGFDLRNEVARMEAAEEYIANAAEGDLTPTMWDKIVKFVNDLMKDLGMGTGWTRADILRLLQDSKQLVEGDRYAHFLNDGSHLRTAFYSLNETRNSRFNSELDHLIDGSLGDGHVFDLGNPSNILRASGFPDLPIELAASRLQTKQGKHDYPIEAIYNLPEALQNPVAVFDSRTKIGRKTVLTELVHEGRNFLAAVELNKGESGISVNDIRSVYPKQAKRIVKSILDGYGQYYNKEKAQSWLDQQRSHYAEVIKHELGSAYKIINDFENPNVRETGIRYSVNPALSETKFAYQRRFDGFVRKFQDAGIAMKRLQDGLEREGGSITDQSDVYQEENLARGRRVEQIRRFEERKQRPLKQYMRQGKKDLGIEYRDYKNYLYARHAPEANADLLERNPEGGESQSGMSDSEAKEIMDSFAGKKGWVKHLEGFAEQVDSIIEDNLKAQLAYGLITPGQYATYKNQFDYYVPLRGWEDWEGTDPTLYVGPERRGGRSTRAGDILAYTFGMYETTMLRGEKNLVKQKALRLLQDNYNRSDLFRIRNVYWKDTGEVDESGKKRYIATYTKPTADQLLSGEYVQHLDKDTMMGIWEQKDPHQDTTVRVMVKGRPVVMEFKDPHVPAWLNGLDNDQISEAAEKLQKYMGYLRNAYITYSPEFTPRNFFRDGFTAAFHVATDFDYITAGKIVNPKRLNRIRRSVWKALRHDNFDTEYGRQFEKYMGKGAISGYFQLAPLKKVSKDLKDFVDNHAHPWQRTKEFGRAIDNYMQAYTATAEQMVRFSTFDYLLKNSVINKETGKPYTEKQAAAYAKNLTVNFDRRGSWGHTIGSLWLFYNATIQGINRQFEPFSHGNAASRKRRAAAASLLMSGMGYLATEALRYGLGTDDDDEDYVDKISDFTIAHRFMVPNFFSENDGDLISIPLPYGLNNYWAAGVYANKLMAGTMTPEEAVLAIGSNAWSSFNPIGGEASERGAVYSGFKTFLPEIAVPPFEYLTNENFAGRPIRPEPYQFGASQPNSERYWYYTSDWAKNVARALNSVTGGDKYEPGLIDVSPNDLEFFISSYTGGAGNFILSLLETGENLSNAVLGDEEFTTEDALRIPMVRVCFSRTPNSAARSRFFENRTRLEQMEWKHKQLLQDEGSDAAVAYWQENQELMNLIPFMDATRKQISKSYDYLNALDARDGSKEEQEEVLKRIKSLHDNFNRRYNQVTGRASSQNPTLTNRTVQSLTRILED